MKKIYLKDINFDKLIELKDLNPSNSKLYCDEKKINFIKIYTEDSTIFMKERFNIISELEPIPNVLLPHTVILSKKNKIEGCITPYKPSALQMFSFFDYFNDKHSFCEVVRDSSKTLENIHDNGIVVGDLSFKNILFDLGKNHYYCDFDSIAVSACDCYIPGLIGWYLKYRNLDNLKVDDNFDRFSLFLHFVIMLFSKNLNMLTEEKIEKESEELPFLNDMKDLLLVLQNRNANFPEIPYLHDLIPEEVKIYQKKQKSTCHNKKNII